MRNINTIHKSLRIWNYQMSLHLKSKKVIIVALMLFLYVRTIIRGFVDFSNVFHINVTPYLFPLLADDFVILIIFVVGYIIMICDAPFMNHAYLFTIARAGKRSWCLGELLFINSFAVLYTIFLFFISVVNLIPNILWENEWGKIIKTLALMDSGREFHIYLNVSGIIVHNYEPIEALVKSIILVSMGLSIIGTIIFLCNYMFKNFIGLTIGCGLAVFDLAIYNGFPYSLYKYSPVSLMKLSTVTGVRLWNPTYTYAVVAMGSVIVILGILTIISVDLKPGIKTE